MSGSFLKNKKTFFSFATFLFKRTRPIVISKQHFWRTAETPALDPSAKSLRTVGNVHNALSTSSYKQYKIGLQRLNFVKKN
jgi:hypothetical protein